MRKVLLLSGLLLLAVAIFLTFPCYKRVFAVDGCCKDRSSAAGIWSRNGKNYEACKNDNQRRDGGDDLLQPAGLVWWDLQCR